MFKILVDGDVYAPAPLGRRSILVCGEQIVWIGAGEPQLDPEFAVERVELGGRRVIPGLIDGHVHVTGGGGEVGPASRVPSLPLSAYTLAGVTSVIGLLGTDDTTRATADLVARTRALRAEGISAWCYTGGYHLPPTTLTGSVRGDIVNVGPIIGVGEVALSDHRSSQPTLDDLLAVAADVHTAGMLAAKAGVVHLHMGDGERGLEMVGRALAGTELPARVFQPTHVNRRRALLDEAFALAERGVPIDVTAFPAEHDGDGVGAVEAITSYLEAGLPEDRLTVSSDAGGSLPRFDDRGVAIGMGVGSPSTLSLTIAALLAAGHKPAAVLPMFTSNVAGALRLARKGAIAVGHDADLVVLDDRDRPGDVMARGRWHVCAGQPIVGGTFEELA